MNNVIIFNPYSEWNFHLNYEIPIYYNLISRGMQPVYLRCGLEQSECDLHWRAAAGPRPENACDSCNAQTDHSLRAAGINYGSLSEFIDSSVYENFKNLVRGASYQELKELKVYDFRVLELALSSVFTHLRINQFNSEDEDQLVCLREYMIYTIGTLIAGDAILKHYRPKAALIFNGRMAPTRAFMELCLRHGVRVVTHERGVTRGGLHLVVNGSCQSMSYLEDLSKHSLKYPLKPYQVRLTAEWFKQRRAGRNLNWKYFQIDGSAAPEAIQSDDFTHWVLFTSSMDEINSSSEFFSPFGNQYQWIDETCRAALEFEDKVRLTIRVHPNSSSTRSTGINKEEQTFFRKLKDSMGGTSIKIIESHEAIDSYLLLDQADLVLAYASTIALEALIAGKSTFVAAHSPWAYCQGIMSYKSHPDYWSFLQERNNKTSCNLDASARAQGFRFAYNILYNHQISFPFLHQISHGSSRLVVDNISDFAEGMYPELDKSVDILLGQRVLFDSATRYFDEDCVEAEISQILDSMTEFRRPLFSVVITNYNYAGYLRNCFESVIAQNEPDIEIIIVDDGSTDDSKNIISKLIAEHPTAKIIPVLQENSGQPAIARNNGIKIATGHFILPLDADDMIAKGYLNGCRRIIQERPEVNLIAANWFSVYPDKEPALSRPRLFNMGRLSQDNVMVVASVYSKTLWEKVGGYRENVRGYEDWDMWLNMSMNGAIPAYLDAVGLIYNAKDSGLYYDALKRHDNLYANIILNNRMAYRGNLLAIKWAENYLRMSKENSEAPAT